jgi:hypothetical protein
MGNVLRVLAIVAASVLLGLAGLFLLLFTICGGLQSKEGGSILAICLAVIAGAITVIVAFGRALVSSNKVAQGLAVPPSVVVPPPGYATPAPAGAPTITPQSPYAPSPAPGAYQPLGTVPAATAPYPRASRPVVPLRPFGGSDLQVLIGLRVALAVYILVSVGSMFLNLVTYSRVPGNLAIQLLLQNMISVLPPAAVLIAVSIRNPPAGGALDATVGLAVASIMFRFGYMGFSSLITTAYANMAVMPSMLLRMGAYSALEATIAGLALYLRSRIGPLNPAGLVLATVAFLFWEGIAQAMMTMLFSLLRSM